MTVLSSTKIRMLAQKHGWSIARAEGYCRGESARGSCEPPSKYLIVGIDEYALGFRAGYFLRESDSSFLETTATNAAIAKHLQSGG